MILYLGRREALVICASLNMMSAFISQHLLRHRELINSFLPTKKTQGAEMRTKSATD